MAAELRHLFTPLALRGIELRNRILMTGATTNMAYGGLPGEQLADYYAERARGGAGLIVTEMTVVHPSGIVMDRAIQNWDDRVLSGFRLLAAGVHRHGGKVFAQVGHPGRQGRSFFSEQPLLAPSALPSPAHHEVPKEAELEDVSDLVRCYANGAARALEAGMDGVEIHSAYGGYFLAQWLSPTTNTRGDDYGGPLEQRLRIVLDVVDAVRQAAGPDVPVGIQITGDEGVPGGLTPDDAVAIARLLDQHGGLDYVTVKAGTWAVKELIAPDMQYPHGLWVEHAARVRAAVHNFRVFTVGRIVDPLQAEQILASGKADMVGMTRAQMADPELAAKARDGLLDDIRPCIGSNEGCQDAMFIGRHLTCTVNPAVGKERAWGIGTLERAPRPRRILIVGGGPAGLKAAEVAGRRGHDVHVWEREAEVGGQVRILARVRLREEYKLATRYLENQLRKLERIELTVERDATAADVLAFDADAVVLACGSLPGRDGIRHLRSDLAPIAGLDSPVVIDVSSVLTALPAGVERVLVADDGENSWKVVGTAVQLAEEGCRVTVVTPQASIGTGLSPMSIGPALRRLFALEVETRPYRAVCAIAGNAVEAVNVVTGEREELGSFDLVVTAFHNRANDVLYRELRGSVSELHRIGDCLAPRRVIDAVREGEALARAL